MSEGDFSSTSTLPHVRDFAEFKGGIYRRRRVGMGGVGLVQKEAGDVNDYDSKEITAEAAAGFMEAAFELAREALAAGEVPVGAVIVAGGQVGAAEK